MIQISYLLICFILLLVWIVYRVINHKKNKDISVLREITINLFFLYILALIFYTLFKSGSLILSFNNFEQANTVPFKETMKMLSKNHSAAGRALYNIIGNIMLFVPFGFFIPLLFDKYNNVFKIAFYGLITSLLIEIAQYFTFMNITDIDDVIFNTAGAVIGIFAYKFFVLIAKVLKLGFIIDGIKDYHVKNLFLAAIKPVFIMILCCGVFITYTIYKNTFSSKALDEKFAIQTFAEGGSNSVSSKEFDKYKLFLEVKGRDIILSNFQRGFINRYVLERSTLASLNDTKYGYKVGILEKNKDNSRGVVVFGKNNGAKSIVITYNKKEYTEELKGESFFIVAYPEFKRLGESSDIYNINNNQPSKDLQIKFMDENGLEYKGMKLAK